MRAEERAALVWEQLAQMNPPVSRDAEMAAFAQAIRDAEGAAYERAAAKLDAFADHAETVGFVAAKSRTGRDKARSATRAYRTAAYEVRSLKSTPGK